MVTKTDFETFRQEVRETVTAQVEAAVAPLRTDYRRVEQRLIRLEQANTTGSTTGLDPQDVAFKQVTFLGFPANVAAQERLQVLNDFCAQFPGYNPQLGNNYRGPRKTRELKSTSFAQFVNTDARDAFLKEAEGKTLTCKGKNITLKPGLPHWYRYRDYKLGEAKKVLTSHNGNSATGLVYEKVEKTRVLKLNGQVAFQQLVSDAEGSFTEAFSHLTLVA